MMVLSRVFFLTLVSGVLLFFVTSNTYSNILDGEPRVLSFPKMASLKGGQGCTDHCVWQCLNSDIPCGQQGGGNCIPEGGYGGGQQGVTDTCLLNLSVFTDYTPGMRCVTGGTVSCDNQGQVFRCWEIRKCECQESGSDGWICIQTQTVTNYLDLGRCRRF